MIESDVLSWNSKVANAILAQVQGTSWANPERASSWYINSIQVYARRRPRRGRATTIALPGTLTEASFVESLVAYHIKGTVDSISEEVLGIDRKLLHSPSVPTYLKVVPSQQTTLSISTAMPPWRMFVNFRGIARTFSSKRVFI